MPFLPQPDVAGAAILRSFGWAPADLLASEENLAKFQAAGGGFSGAPAIQTAPGDIRARGGNTYLPVVPPMPSLPPGLSLAQLPGFDPYAPYTKNQIVRGTPLPTTGPYVLPWDKNWQLEFETGVPADVDPRVRGGRGPIGRWNYGSTIPDPWYKDLLDAVRGWYGPVASVAAMALTAPATAAVGATGAAAAAPSFAAGVGSAGAGSLLAAAPSFAALATGPLKDWALRVGLNLAETQLLPRSPDVPGPPGPPPSARAAQSPRLSTAFANLQATLTRLRQSRTTAGGTGATRRQPSAGGATTAGSSPTRLTTALANLRKTLEGVRTAQARRPAGGFA